MLDKELDECISKIYQQAIFNRHEYLTMEHLMLGLLKNSHVRDVLEEVDCDINLLKTELQQHIDQYVQSLPNDIDFAPQPTTAFQRVMQRAIYSAQSAEVPVVTGDRVLIAFFEEPECHVVYLLAKQGIERYDIVSYIAHGDHSSIDAYEANSEGENKEKKDTVEDYLINLNKKAEEGHIDN